VTAERSTPDAPGGRRVVEDHDVARLQRGDEDLFHIEAEQLAVDRAINDPWRVDPIVA
jgi:hypothetical protein